MTFLLRARAYTFPLGLCLAILVAAVTSGAAQAGVATPAGTPGAAFALRAVSALGPWPITATDGAANDEFGTSVAISGDTAVVGAPWDELTQGAVYVFVRSGTTWSQQAKLVADEDVAYDQFGKAVAISGDTVLVGAHLDDVAGNYDQGAVYVFVRSGTTWSQQAKLVAPDGAAYDEFGGSVAISADTVVVGARFHNVGYNSDQGAVYVFVRSGTTWSEQAKLVADDGGPDNGFGLSVAISGDSTLVSGGGAYAFVRSGTTWSQQAKLVAADSVAGDSFGSSVAISGDAAVVGAPLQNAKQGAAYVFSRSGTTWSQQAKLTATDGVANDFFGTSVAIAGKIAVVGACLDDVGSNVDLGSAYAFTTNGSTWSQQAHLVAEGASGDTFGSSLAMSDLTLIGGACHDDVGANTDQGSSYIYRFAKPEHPTPRSPTGIIDSRTPTFRWWGRTGTTTYEVRIYRGTKLLKTKTGIRTTWWKCAMRLPRGVALTWKVRGANVVGTGPWSARLRFRVR